MVECDVVSDLLFWIQREQASTADPKRLLTASHLLSRHDSDVPDDVSYRLWTSCLAVRNVQDMGADVRPSDRRRPMWQGTQGDLASPFEHKYTYIASDRNRCVSARTRASVRIGRKIEYRFETAAEAYPRLRVE